MVNYFPPFIKNNEHDRGANCHCAKRAKARFKEHTWQTCAGEHSYAIHLRKAEILSGRGVGGYTLASMAFDPWIFPVYAPHSCKLGEF